MKKLYIALIALTAMLMAGCKENNWMDWKAENELWLANKLKTDPTVIMTADSLLYTIVADPNPTDVRPQSTSSVVCDYTGELINGYRFDAGNGAQFSMNGLIAGFSEGLTKIHAHGDIIIYIPWQLGYGADGSGTEGTSGYIPPYSTLIFKVHLSAVQ